LLPDTRRIILSADQFFKPLFPESSIA